MNFAIIGFGKMGCLYDKLLNASYIVDQNPVKNRVYFSSVDEFINYNQPVDLVIVATPTNYHYSICRKLLKNRYNVLVEKPICLSSVQAAELEKIARQKKLVLYQSTLERYNPVIKYLLKSVSVSQIKQIVSYRYGDKPEREYIEETKFDLGIHDVDLWFSLFKKQVPWIVNFGYGKRRRGIIVFLKNSKIIRLNLINKLVRINDRVVDLSKNASNPIIEMVKQVMHSGYKKNENWSKEIQVIEETKTNSIFLTR